MFSLLFPKINIFSPQAGTTWSQDGIADISFHHPSPESCQELCTSSPSCQAFTWLAPEAPILPLSCSLFDLADTSQVMLGISTK